MQLNRSGRAFRTYCLLRPELPHHPCREVILHGVVEDKWTLCRPQRPISEANGVKSMAFLERHDFRQLVWHPSNLENISSKIHWCYYNYKVTNIRNELQVLIEEGTKAANLLLYSMYACACVAYARATQSQR
jgi:hypothetical protein